MIKKTVTHMSQLTDQLLAYAKGGKYKSQLIEVTNLIKTTLSLTKHTIPPNVQVVTNWQGGLPMVKVDSTQMQMALSAIISNACEAMHNGGRIDISIHTKQINPNKDTDFNGLVEGEYVAIDVKDEGVGMTPDTMDRIFEPFFSTKFQGRGLAMAAVYGIMQNHHGHIRVESQPGEGTHVSLLLPAHQKAETPAERAPEMQLSGSGTILLVEDEELVMEVNEAILTRLGYSVIGARTGKDAIRFLEAGEKEIDLIMLDIKLPDMDGSALFPIIQSRKPASRVVLCSGFALDDETQALMDSGAHGFIQKPFSMEAIGELLKDVLAAKS